MILNEVARRCGFTGAAKSGRFGIEIETEVKSSTSYPSGFLAPHGADDEGHSKFKVEKLPSWTAKTDGSLRNFGIEYILNKPLTYTETIKALREFKEGTVGIPFLEEQPSTSVHVHMNFGPEKLLTLANFIQIWTLFENILVDFAGPTRRSNLFAVPTRVAEQQCENYVKLLKGLEMGAHASIMFNQQSCKYASLNLGCLGKLNSLEARSFRGTTDTDQIENWIGILNRMFEFSKTSGLNPSNFFHSYHSEGVKILSDVFGPYANYLKCDGFIEMMERQETYLYDIATSVKNWDTFGLNFAEVKTKPKDRRQTAHEATQLYGSILTGADTTFVMSDSLWGPVAIDEFLTTEPDEDF